MITFIEHIWAILHHIHNHGVGARNTAAQMPGMKPTQPTLKTQAETHATTPGPVTTSNAHCAAQHTPPAIGPAFVCKTNDNINAINSKP